METKTFMLREYPWDERYRIHNLDHILTPALLAYPEFIASNIQCTLRLLDGNADRWRAHVKTAKLGYTMRMLVERGVGNFKCATTLELMTACHNGADDVLLAYPVMGPNARRAWEIADQFPNVQISVLAENEQQLQQWQGRRVGVFLDINPGMNRTGIEQTDSARVIRLIRAMRDAAIPFRGLHYYDGQYGRVAEPEKTAATHAGYDRLLGLAGEIEGSGFQVPEIITAGTPSFPCSLTYKAFSSGGFIHRVSPGTLVYSDATSLAQLPEEYGYRPAVLVLSRVVSRPNERIVTSDAGHKSVSADAGVPTCLVLGHPELTPLAPSEEHLPLENKSADGPKVGESLYVLARHICPTVNNFDSALLVKDGQVEALAEVSARGHETPLLASGSREPQPSVCR